MSRSTFLSPAGRKKAALLTALFGCAVLVACSGEEDPSGSNDSPAGSTGGAVFMGEGDGDGTSSGGDGDGIPSGDGDGDGSSDDLDQGALAGNCNGQEPIDGQSCDEDGLVCHDAKRRTCVCGGLTDGGDFGWNPSAEWECYSIGSLPTGSGGSDGSGGQNGSGGMGGFGGAEN